MTDSFSARRTARATVRSRPKAGRPTREQAEQRREELLDCALDMFLDSAFEGATIEAIATKNGMAKRTIYAYYADKAALFYAAIERAVDQWIVPLESLQAAETGNLEETLIAVAHIRLANVLSPVGVKLQRILTAESFRFPGLYRLAYDRSTAHTVAFIADLLKRHPDTATAQISDDQMLATAFLSLVVGGPMWGSLWGVEELDQSRVDAYITTSVRLFLDGVRSRP